MKKPTKLNGRNIILIGMCGAGKSTVGVLLAKELNCHFLDTDVYIQVLENKNLQEIIDDVGIKKFCEIEESHILCIDIKNACIATGGSVVYSYKVMKHLGKNSIIIHLDLDLETIEDRVNNLYTRGTVMEKGQTLKSLYDQRQPLYKKYAQITIDCSGKTHGQIVKEITNYLI